MVLRVKNIEIPVQEVHEAKGEGAEGSKPKQGFNAVDPLLLKRYAAKTLEISTDDILQLRVHKKSLDARRNSRIVYRYQLDLSLDSLKNEAYFAAKESATREVLEEATTALHQLHPLQGIKTGSVRHRPVVIGSGPAGIFAALILAQSGQPSIIVERGETVAKRLKTVGKLRRGEGFSEKSNYCFGEGGAGTFSDGKLTCGRNHPYVKYLFQEWVRHGAPESILYEAHPHIGTDNLLKIAHNQRQELLDLGCQFLFETQWTDFEYHGETPSPLTGGARYTVQLSDGQNLKTDHLIVAVGHSARDTYQMLLERGLALAPKPFAMGARLEHPQEVINKIQYGQCDLLPAAEYKLAAQKGERGIWTFCMCPGGHLLPTNAQEGHLAINGMSYYARSSSFANAAVVVNVMRQDFFKGHPLDGMHFQAAIERHAFREGGGNYHAPAQRLLDFVKGQKSKGTLTSSYLPGIQSARMDKILPTFIADSLRQAVGDYNQKMRGFLHPEAMVVGVETKTSSPVVMMRDKGFQSVSHPGFFPTGEGAGFAGGIVSAALDGVRVGRAVLEDMALVTAEATSASLGV
jgi:uncharacterized FAD-dependent dehydrogenase